MRDFWQFLASIIRTSVIKVGNIEATGFAAIVLVSALVAIYHFGGR